MGKPTKLHDVQKLTGRVTVLSRFIARLGEKVLPFYALMKKSDDKFERTEEADTAFAQLKKVFSTPPVLVTQMKKSRYYYILQQHIKW
jgi:flavoprotein